MRRVRVRVLFVGSGPSSYRTHTNLWRDRAHLVSCVSPAFLAYIDAHPEVMDVYGNDRFLLDFFESSDPLPLAYRDELVACGMLDVHTSDVDCTENFALIAEQVRQCVPEESRDTVELVWSSCDPRKHDPSNTAQLQSLRIEHDRAFLACTGMQRTFEQHYTQCFDDWLDDDDDDDDKKEQSFDVIWFFGCCSPHCMFQSDLEARRHRLSQRLVPGGFVLFADPKDEPELCMQPITQRIDQIVKQYEEQLNDTDTMAECRDTLAQLACARAVSHRLLIPGTREGLYTLRH
jgi:hypothetical protein